jgi:uncharacterized membrane protein
MSLTKYNKLRLVKMAHTLIWMVMATVVFFVLWSGITAKTTTYSWLAVLAVVIEGIILVIFGGSCPLTRVARRYSSSRKDNFDIYLPNWLAKYNKGIFTTIFIIGLTLMIFHYFFPASLT